MSDPSTWSFATQQIHAGQAPDPSTGSRALPIHQTTSFVFDSTEQAANRFALSELGPIYTRINNPTQEAVENKIAALEGGIGALLTASGMSATALAIQNVAEAGDHVVASAALYGGTINLFLHTLPKFGIEVTLVEDLDDLEAWKAAIKPNTKAFFGETIGNPKATVLDIAGIAGVAHEAGVPFIVDNTIATPYVLRPIEHGADIVVHAATKFLGGHGNSIAGVIVDSGNFDFAADPEKFKNFNEPDPGYHGLRYGPDLGVGGAMGANLAFILKARVQLLRDLGPAISPFNAFLIGTGIETLSLRMQRHLDNTREVTEFLGGHAQVEKVIWASLPDNPSYERAQKYTPKGAGSVISFEIKGGLEAGKKFVEGLSLHSHLANIGDTRSLVIHPASTTHSQGPEEDRLAAGVTPGLVRLSIGLEDPKDIIADLEEGFAAAK